MFLILNLVFKTPLKKIVIILPRVKHGRGGPIVMSTVSNGSHLPPLQYGQDPATHHRGSYTQPYHQIIMSKHMLEASLIGIFEKLFFF